MVKSRFAVWSMIAGTLITLVAIEGCGREEKARVDARFASAEALLEQYNERCMRGPVVDPRPVLDLYRAENERQARLISVMHDTTPLLELDQALWDRFGAGIDPTATMPPLAPNRGPATVTTTLENRATASYVSNDGSTGTLYLVRHEGRWWISGHTLEPEGDPEAIDAVIAARERTTAYLAPVAPLILERLNRGDFRSKAEAGFALGQAVADRFPEVGTNPALLKGVSLAE